jgi:hypothetical protein
VSCLSKEYNGEDLKLTSVLLATYSLGANQVTEFCFVVVHHVDDGPHHTHQSPPHIHVMLHQLLAVADQLQLPQAALHHVVQLAKPAHQDHPTLLVQLPQLLPFLSIVPLFVNVHFT